MYKLIAIDIDGTLLNSNSQVSNENKKAISYALSKSVDVVLSSGRMPNTIIPIANEIKANKYLIAGNGSLIYNIQNEKLIYTNYLSKEKVLEVVDFCEKHSMFYNVYTTTSILTKSLDYNTLFYFNENKKNPEDKKINISIMDNIYEYVKKYQNNDFLKITICDNNEFVFKRIIQKLTEIKNVDILKVLHMSKKIIKHGSGTHEIKYFYTEITNKNVNKWTAIKELTKILNIKEEEVIAIGDNFNDAEMIKNAGIGVATRNSFPEIQNIANIVVSSNDENGVAEAIYRCLN